MSKYLFILALFLIFFEAKSQSHNGYDYISAYLKREHKIEIDTFKEVVVVFLYCSHCNNCESRLNKKELFRLLDTYPSIVVFDEDNKLALSLIKKPHTKILLDTKQSFWKYGLSGVEHRYFLLAKKQIIKKGLIGN